MREEVTWLSGPDGLSQPYTDSAQVPVHPLGQSSLVTCYLTSKVLAIWGFMFSAAADLLGTAAPLVPTPTLLPTFVFLPHPARELSYLCVVLGFFCDLAILGN